MILSKKTIKAMYEINWGIHHLFGNFYLVKMYSPRTKGLRRLIWVIDYAKERK
jgi:hypothetical protein